MSFYGEEKKESDFDCNVNALEIVRVRPSDRRIFRFKSKKIFCHHCRDCLYKKHCFTIKSDYRFVCDKCYWAVHTTFYKHNSVNDEILNTFNDRRINTLFNNMKKNGSQIVDFNLFDSIMEFMPDVNYLHTGEFFGTNVFVDSETESDDEW